MHSAGEVALGGSWTSIFGMLVEMYCVGGEPQNIKSIVPRILLHVTKLNILSLKRESI